MRASLWGLRRAPLPCSECWQHDGVQGQKKEARQYVKRLLQMGSGSGILIAAVILLGRGWLPQLFSPDPHVIAAAARALPIVAAAMVRLLRYLSSRCRPVGHIEPYTLDRKPECRPCERAWRWDPGPS